MAAVLMLKQDTVRPIGGSADAALLLLLLLLSLMMLLLAVLRVLMLMVAGEGAQAAQAGGVGLGGGSEGRLGVWILSVLRGAVAVHQSVSLGDLMRSIELLRWEGGRLLLSGHGVDGRAHGLSMAACNGGGTPALGLLWDRTQRA